MDLSDGADTEPPPPLSSGNFTSWQNLIDKQSEDLHASVPWDLPQDPALDDEEPFRPLVGAHGLENGQDSRKVVTGLPRSQTFKRQLSEERRHLAPFVPTADERRGASVDRRSQSRQKWSPSQPRVSAPSLLGSSHDDPSFLYDPLFRSTSQTEDGSKQKSRDQIFGISECRDGDETPPQIVDVTDAQSMTASQHEAMINDELERKWILNLSMHFRDRSKREKFFVTYREQEHLWRRVTISLDYRFAPPNSLEMDLIHTKFQREKSAKIYEAIRESLLDIQFYDTVTNLKLETTDGRLHVHVVEDGNEIINYPPVSQVRHLGCRRIRERDIVFNSHMSGFVYKVSVRGQVLIKKEIPSQDTIEEFLYEVNALNSLRYSHDVVRFYGVVVDDQDNHVKGLLISYASQGALIDIIYERCKERNHGIPWATKERWARQIVRGLADVHDSGFVQGDFTLSNIVVDDADNAKIIDINRRGCPVDWEPPEATALIEAGHRITMYIGVKSDLYQLGMVLWALAMEEDEPECHGRPLMLGPEINVPDWYRQITEMCLSADPRMRLQASSLLQMFPPTASDNGPLNTKEYAISVDDGRSVSDYFVDGYHADGRPLIRTVDPARQWPYSGKTYVESSPAPYESYYPARGRSPPSPLPSDYACESSRDPFSKTSWAANRSVRPSYTDAGADDTMSDDMPQPDHDHETPTAAAKDIAEDGLGNASEQGGPRYTDLSALPDAFTSHNAAASGDVSSPETLGVTLLDGPSSPMPYPTVAAPVPNLNKDETVVNTSLLKPAQLETSSDAAAEHIQAPEAPATCYTEELARHVGEARQAVTRDDRSEMAQVVSVGDGTAGRVAPTGTGCHLKPQEPVSASHDDDSGTEADREPEYVATQGSGNTEPGIDEHKSKDTAAFASTAEFVAHRQINDSHAAKKWLANQGMNGFEARRSKEPLWGHPKPDYPRKISLPVTLTGIGAAYMGVDDEMVRGKNISDDDLSTMVRASTVPARIITTDSRT